MKIEHDTKHRDDKHMTASTTICSRVLGWHPLFKLHKAGAAVEFDEAEARDAVRLLTEQLAEFDSGETAQRVADMQRGQFSRKR
ncbi:MAG TPA: hypothetical protein VGG84_15180 [Gemmatimonadaceae bacterium]